jgi:hypothetical protein
MNKGQEQVLQYIKDNKIPLVDNNVIWVGIQESCDMATVELNGHCLMMGNNWDFHNNCHGMKIPDFSSYRELSLIFKDALIAADKDVELVVDSQWKYEDDECDDCDDGK